VSSLPAKKTDILVAMIGLSVCSFPSRLRKLATPSDERRSQHVQDDGFCAFEIAVVGAKLGARRQDVCAAGADWYPDTSIDLGGRIPEILLESIVSG
jgi:hypothetical protein